MTAKIASRSPLDRLGFWGPGLYSYGNAKEVDIWLFWNDTISLTDITWHEQCVTVTIVEPSNDANIMLSFVHADCNMANRQLLWNYLVGLSDSIDIPWGIVGDFNAISCPEEKKGHLPPNESSMQAFNEFQINAGVIDAGFSVELDSVW